MRRAFTGRELGVNGVLTGSVLGVTGALWVHTYSHLCVWAAEVVICAPRRRREIKQFYSEFIAIIW